MCNGGRTPRHRDDLLRRPGDHRGRRACRLPRPGDRSGFRAAPAGRVPAGGPFPGGPVPRVSGRAADRCPSSHPVRPRAPAPSSAPTSCWNGSAKGAWARSGWPSSASPCSARWPSRSSRRAWTPARWSPGSRPSGRPWPSWTTPTSPRSSTAAPPTSGRPYFVMELVKGTPITTYCDEHRLTLRERLELFLPVCQAIQHAHQKGIIHRDIKPSNVLIAPYDGRPVPKIIDFGVAKAIGQRLTERTLVHGVRGGGGHAGVHVARAGRAEQPGHRHAQRHLHAGCVAVRAADRHDADEPRAADTGGVHGDAAGDPRGGAAQAEHAAERFQGDAAVDRGAAAHGAGQADERCAASWTGS